MVAPNVRATRTSRAASTAALSGARRSACDKVQGTKTRTAIVNIQPQNGGRHCPAPESEACIVNCEGQWGPWSQCAGGTSSGPFFETRKFVVSVEGKNGGEECPLDEQRECNPDICYSIEGAGEEGLKSLQRSSLKPFAISGGAKNFTDFIVAKTQHSSSFEMFGMYFLASADSGETYIGMQAAGTGAAGKVDGVAIIDMSVLPDDLSGINMAQFCWHCIENYQ